MLTMIINTNLFNSLTAKIVTLAQAREQAISLPGGAQFRKFRSRDGSKKIISDKNISVILVTQSVINQSKSHMDTSQCPLSLVIFAVNTQNYSLIPVSNLIFRASSVTFNYLFCWLHSSSKRWPCFYKILLLLWVVFSS